MLQHDTVNVNVGVVRITWMYVVHACCTFSVSYWFAAKVRV